MKKHRKNSNNAGECTSKYAKRRYKPKRLINIIFSQKTTIILLLILQFVLIFLTFTYLSEQYTYLHVIFATISIALVIYMLNTSENSAYKLAWIVPLLAIPVFTVVVFLLLKNQPQAKRLKNKYAKKCANTKAFLQNDKTTMMQIKEENPELYKLANYVEVHGGYPICKNVYTEYFPLGEDKFKAMVRELKKANEFIFMEYFIVDNGEMWGEIMDILLEKSHNGVEVRVLCDGVGSQFILPAKDVKQLRKSGVKFLYFNKFIPMLSTIQNNRDHRKILVIDGKVAFTGGINIADEYINRRVRFGHWKDNAVMTEGEAVWNYTMMFLQMWEVISGDIAQYDMYRPKFIQQQKEKPMEGYVIPYADSPLDNENVGKMVYMNIINNATDYVYITTPYLIPDEDLINAMEFAAKSGVDVRIIVPGIPDKWYAYCITQSYYHDLMAVGVKIYEYDPGFIHAKTFLSDDKKAVVGTINLDYRSLYLHFECAHYMEDVPCIKDIKADFEDMFRNKCHLVTSEEYNNRSFFSKFMSVILRIFAPLM